MDHPVHKDISKVTVTLSMGLVNEPARDFYGTDTINVCEIINFSALNKLVTN